MIFIKFKANGKFCYTSVPIFCSSEMPLFLAIRLYPYPNLFKFLFTVKDYVII